MVGERGPELRYESKGGFIAHHNILRGLVDLSNRVRSPEWTYSPARGCPNCRWACQLGEGRQYRPCRFRVDNPGNGRRTHRAHPPDQP